MDAQRVVRLAGVHRLMSLCDVSRDVVRSWAKDDWIPPLIAAQIYRDMGLRFSPRPRQEHAYPGPSSSFFAYVRPGIGDECWGWAGFTEKNGTGRHYYGGRLYRAQRLALEMVTDRPVPAGRVVVTGCGNRSCVNPEHLWAVPRGEAARASYARRITP
jgi:hypothetical protein